MPNQDGTTTVVHCRKEPFDIYIGRPGKWGNPFSHLSNSAAQFRVATRNDAIEAFRKWILTQPALLKDIKELKGKVLGCWCRPNLACHGDVLAELANALPK